MIRVVWVLFGSKKPDFVKVEFNVFVVAIIEIISKAMSTVTTTETKNESIVEAPDYVNLWEVQKFKEDDFWFMKVGQ